MPLVLGKISLWRLGRHSRPVDGGSWGDLLARAQAALGFRRDVRLLESDRRAMPMLWGLWRPWLLVPAEAESWPALRRWVVLLHELAHAKRWDCATKLLAHVACAVYWFNPLAWLAFKRMQTEAEAACDDLVLASDHSNIAELKPSDYATHLLEIASGFKSSMLAAYSSIAMARRSKLEGRLLAILDGGRSRRRLTFLVATVAVLLMAGLAVPLAMLHARDANQATAEANSLSGTRATSQAIQPPRDAKEAIAHLEDLDEPHLIEQAADTIARELISNRDQLGKREIEKTEEAAAKWVKSDPERVRAAGVQIGLAAGRKEYAGLAIELLRSRNYGARYRAAYSLQVSRRLLSTAQIDQLTDFLLGNDDPATYWSLYSLLKFSAREHPAPMWRLVASDKPWLWWQAASELGSWRWERLAPSDLSEKARVHLVAAGKLSDKSLDSQASQAVVESLTPRLMSMSISCFSGMFDTVAQRMDKGAGTKLVAGILQRLLDEWDDWKVEGHGSSNDSAVYYCIRQLNRWNGTRLGNLPDAEPEDLHSGQRDWKALAAEAIEWAKAHAPRGFAATQSADARALEGLARRVLEALRDRDLETLNAFSAGSAEGWLGDQPIPAGSERGYPDGWSAERLKKVLAAGLPETIAKNPDGSPMVAESVIEGDWAATRSPAPKRKDDLGYVMLTFVRTSQGWRLASMGEAGGPLKDVLLRMEAPWLKKLKRPATSMPTVRAGTRQLATRPTRWTPTEEYPAAILDLAEREDKALHTMRWWFEGVTPEVFSDGPGTLSRCLDHERTQGRLLFVRMVRVRPVKAGGGSQREQLVEGSGHHPDSRAGRPPGSRLRHPTVERASEQLRGVRGAFRHAAGGFCRVADDEDDGITAGDWGFDGMHHPQGRSGGRRAAPRLAGQTHGRQDR